MSKDKFFRRIKVMEFKKCSRCGNFYVSEGFVCPKCSPKDTFEFSTFKSYIAENGLGDSIDTISSKTGISVKNLNRFMEYDKTINNNTKNNINDEKLNNIINAVNELQAENNNNNNNGITFLI